MRAVSGAGLLLLAACNSTGPHRAVPLGSYGGPLADRTSYLGLTLVEREGRFSGVAWSSFSASMIAGGRVSGLRDGNRLLLAIQPRSPFGLVNWGFEGVLERDTLKGVITFAGTEAQRVELPRVPAIPRGSYSLRLQGALNQNLEGAAVFNYGGGSFRLIQVFTVLDRSSMVVFWQQRERPLPGSYPASAEGGPAPSVRLVLSPSLVEPGVTWTVTGGRIVIEESERYFLAGQFSLTATGPEGLTLTATARFHAGCTGNAC